MKKKPSVPKLAKDLRTAIRGEVLLTMKTRGWNQTQLGAHLGLTQQAMSKAKSGNAGPDVADTLCERLDLTRDLLLKKLARGDYREAMAEDDAMATSRGRRPRVAMVSDDVPPMLTSERWAALNEENWDDARPGEYEFVHAAIASHRFDSGIEPVTGLWKSQVKLMRATFRGKAKRDVLAGDPNAPDPTVAAEKARRAAKRKP